VLSLVLLCCGEASARTSTVWRVPDSRVMASLAETGDSAFLESLRKDVKRHPGDFLTFATATEAKWFMEDHAAESRLETEQRMVERGVLGYWRGRTVIVLPAFPSKVR
jgi:hypothetical protein